MNDEPPNYEARVETHEHIGQVRGLVLGAAIDLQQRAHRHDRTKLQSPEVEVFDRQTAKLKQLTPRGRPHGYTQEFLNSLTLLTPSYRGNYGAPDG